MPRLAPDQLLEELTPVDDLLIVQDLDGVCMQLVKDPLTRRMDPGYVNAAADLRGSFVVLTNGEHEGRRGVNRLVEAALGDQIKPDQAGPTCRVWPPAAFSFRIVSVISVTLG